MVARSSVEAKYRAVANTVTESCWLRNLLRELNYPIHKATVVLCDNVCAVYMQDKVAMEQVQVIHVPSSSQYVDILTKGLPSTSFLDFRDSLCVHSPPASTEEGW